MASIFTRILNKEIPGKIVYEDDLVFALEDINPQAEVHLLIIPKEEFKTVNDVTAGNELTLGRLFVVAAKLAKEYGVDESGYRLSVNTNKDAGQEVFHIHMHLMGGNKLGSMV